MNNIIIAGAGALGALYGHKFIKKNRNIYFLAEGERQKRLEKEGFSVNGIHYNLKCTGSSGTASTDSLKADLLIVAVKNHQLLKTIEDMKKFINKDTIIISVMNGIDSEEIISRNIESGKIIMTVVLGMDAVRTGNETSYTKEGRVLFGLDTLLSEHGMGSDDSADIEEVKKIFDECDIAYKVHDDIRYQVWFKFMINTGVNQVSAVLDAKYGFMQDNIYAREVMDETMREVIKIANAEGTALSEDDIAKWYRVLGSLGREGKTSMAQDMEAGRKTEVEMFSGKIIELGKKHSIDVPNNLVLYNLIKAKES